MSLALPAALIGLVALPLVWWLHRRLRRPPEVLLPSLMFLQDEEEAASLPRGRVLDAELLLALSALTLLVVAAAGPRIVQQTPHREVQVVVSGGTPAQQRGYRQRVEAVLADLRAGLESDDVLHVRYEPGPAEAGRLVPRPSADALLAGARVGDRSLRVVLSDHAAPPETGDVTWVAVGEPGAWNAAILAVSVQEQAGRLSVFVTVGNEGTEARDLTLTAEARDKLGQTLPARVATWNVAGGGRASATLVLPSTATRIRLALGGGMGLDLDDGLPADDAVLLDRRAVPVFLHPGLPDLHGPIRLGLRAVLGAGGFVELPQAQAGDARLCFVPNYAPVPGSGWIVAFRPSGADTGFERAPAGDNPPGRDPLVRDLRAAGIAWRYAAGARDLPTGAEVLLAREAGRAWPVIARLGQRVLFVPDPLHSVPPVFESAFWPLFLENLVAVAGGGAQVGAGFRAEGLLDPDSSRLGRARADLPPGRLAASPPSVQGAARSMRSPCILGALLCLLLLWGAPRVRRRLQRSRSARDMVTT